MMKPSEVKVLLVEDDEVDKKAFQRAFSKLKISNELLFAGDGIEALEMLRGGENPPLERPVLIVLDINMPRMNGLEFLKEIRADKNLSNLVVFVLTTSRDEKDLVEAYSLNVAGYVCKGDLAGSFSEAINMLEHYWRIVILPNGQGF